MAVAESLQQPMVSYLAAGAVAAVIVLVCTIVQTVYGILAYVNPPE